MRPSFVFLCLCFSGTCLPGSTSQVPPPEPLPYPDEQGFQQRTEGMLAQLASLDFTRRSMASATCPDTGLPVLSWALEGEWVLSPYSGRRFLQGDTGYFGPKQRDAEGRISAFGGDPLKISLPPVAARLLLQPEDLKARAFLAIPGNLRQQYHFACVNWCRLLPLVGHLLPPSFHQAFREAVASYDENRRPSDGPREYVPLERTENLVGRVEEHLGGGGTENHKTMWRTSGLLYAQTFPPGSTISGFSLSEAEAHTEAVLSRYVKALFHLGNGEYDSSTYYPYSLRAFLNLYDFSPKAESRALARAALDYYLATYGLKVFNGLHTGPQRRGWIEGDAFNSMDLHLWVWAGGQKAYSTLPVSPKGAPVSTLHQITSKYRPNQGLLDLIGKNLPLPFEAFLNHPDYGMTTAGRQPEYFFCSKSFALGSVQPDVINNSGQHTTWSLNVRTPIGSWLFGGGQPRWLHPQGHSPYDQWVQKRGALLLMTGATVPPPGSETPSALRRLDQLQGPRAYSRLEAFSGPLDPFTPPPAQEADFETWFLAQRSSAATWLYVPREAVVKTLPTGAFLIETSETLVLLTPFNSQGIWLEQKPVSGASASRSATEVLARYKILVLPGLPSGFALEALERSSLSDLALLSSPRLSLAPGLARYRSLAGDHLELVYQADRLRPRARLNGEEVDWERWAGGAVCASPYLNIKDGLLRLSTPSGAYELDYTGPSPVWRTLAP